MCKAFSGIATRVKVYWEVGLDSHEDIKEHFKLNDFDKDKLCPFEITPNEGYLHPEGKWSFSFDEACPDWWKLSNEMKCWDVFKEWKDEVYGKNFENINLKEARNPINPLLLPEVKKITKKHIKLLKEWTSVWASVQGSVWASVWASVRDSVKGSVGDSVQGSVQGSVWDSVKGSVWDSVWGSVKGSVGDSVWASVQGSVWASVWDSVGDSAMAYISSLFPKIEFKYDFSSGVKLWKIGLVPSFDGKILRLHTGKKAEIVFKISKEKLKGM